MANDNDMLNGKNKPTINPETIKNFSVSRLWLTDGAVLYNDRGASLLSWLFNLVIYFVLCGVHNRIATGQFWLVGVNAKINYIIPSLLQPINIFEFPSYIILYALFTALLVATPILISLLYNLFYAIPFILLNLLLCHELPQALSLFFACLAVSFDPLRFKSKFVSAVLCLAPVVLYWAVFAGPNPWQDSDALRWAIAYSPIAFTYLNCVLFFAIVLLFGHIIRYKPFTVAPFLFLAASITIWQFYAKIGTNERDFRAEVVSFSPKNMPDFQDRSIIPLIEKERAAIKMEQPYLSQEAIDSKIQFRWRWAFSLEPTSVSTTDSEASRTRIAISTARMRAIDSFKGFIKDHPDSKRIVDVLYYRALTVDMRVDQRALRNENSIRFIYTFPSTESELIWRMIQDKFPDSVFAVEARLRLARLLAGQAPANSTGSYNFDQTILFLQDNLKQCDKCIADMEAKQSRQEFWSGMFAGIFISPEPTITLTQARELKWRIEDLISLISLENRAGNLKHESRLAKFIMLDPSHISYEDKLKELLLDSPRPDPLQDNIELELASLMVNLDQKEVELFRIARQYPEQDGGCMAMLRLADLLINEMARLDPPAEKQTYLDRATEMLDEIIARRPDSAWAIRAAEMKSNIVSNPNKNGL
ncbi:MAG: hypothetical protein JXM68_14090 [Sedimentisphaerales bacterium]|nr:hypothetical protein [Sedimentisphaerales bacterium]